MAHFLFYFHDLSFVDDHFIFTVFDWSSPHRENKKVSHDSYRYFTFGNQNLILEYYDWDDLDSKEIDYEIHHMNIIILNYPVANGCTSYSCIFMYTVGLCSNLIGMKMCYSV